MHCCTSFVPATIPCHWRNPSVPVRANFMVLWLEPWKVSNRLQE